MKPYLRSLFSLVLFAVLLQTHAGRAQVEPQLAFEVAAIHPSQRTEGNDTDIFERNGEIRLQFQNISLMNCIKLAYNVKDYQITGPAWLNSQHYDILATAPIPPGVKNAWRPMLQSLLVDRFHLALHQSSKDLPVYALIFTRPNPTLQKADPAASSGVSGRNHQYTFTRISMPRFAEFLTGQADRVVEDATGLSGDYDFTLHFVRESLAVAEPSNDSPDPPLFTALQEQLSLRLVPRKATLNILVIDRMDQTPTEN
jgi:uncharacterized protein (TIGR03435 family)